MTWQEAQRRERERSWSAVERYVADLPPHLFGRVKLVEFDLALRYSPSGQFRDVFAGVAQFPLLSVGSWLVRDLDAPVGRTEAPVERRLFLAALSLALRDHVIERGLDESWFDGAGNLALVQLLTERSTLELVGVPRATASAAARERILRDGLEMTLARRDLWRSPEPPADPARYLLPRWSASARAVGRAALGFAGRDEIAPQVDALVDEVAAAHEILADLSTMHADVLAGRITFPIATVGDAAGMTLQPRLDPTVVLGSLVLTRSIDAIREAAIIRLREGRRIAGELRLGLFSAYLGDVEAALAESSEGRRSPATRPIMLVRPSTSQAIEMAEGYLLSDPLFRESWETHREGMFGAPLVVSRFPAGLILEILGRHGHDLSPAVDAFIDHVVANRFRYYDHPSSGIDTDTVGVVLRLLPAHATPGRWDAAIDTVLTRLEQDVAAAGSIPVWISDPGDGPPDRPSTFDLGEHCGTVAAHLLLGLAAYVPDRHAQTVATGAASLIGRIRDQGLAANVNYVPAYALAVFGRLITRLEGLAAGSGILAEPSLATDEARRVLEGELERQLAWQVATPQQAALLTLACFDLGAPDRVDSRWRAIIVRGQRWDGSWAGEPFAVVPDRSRTVAWYSTSQLTSALCYDALARLERSSGP